MKKIENICLNLTAEEVSKLILISEKSLPFESVALLFGQISYNYNEKKYRYKLEKINEFQNSSGSSTSFSIDNFGLLAQKWQAAQENGLKLISLFHSHPNYAYPSNKDKIYMKSFAKFQNAQYLLEMKLQQEKLKNFQKKSFSASKKLRTKHIVNNPSIIWAIYGNRSKNFNAFILYKKKIFQCKIEII